MLNRIISGKLQYLKLFNCVCYIPAEEKTATLTKILLLLVYYEKYKISCVRRESELLRYMHRLRYGFPREPFFFALPPRGWHRAEFKHLIIAASPSFIILEAGTGQTHLSFYN